MNGSPDSVVLFLIDGMRPDGLRESSTPAMDRLVRSGTSTFSGRTVMPSVTLPCITSLFRGVAPDIHGVTTNKWTPSPNIPPSLFSIVRSKERKTASIFNWEELRDISPVGSLHTSLCIDNSYDKGGTGDRVMAELAAAAIQRERFALTFVYFGHVDTVGHEAGYMSGEYFEAISRADSCIGLVLEAVRGDAAVIVVSDHGGHERSHGACCDEDMTIPIILNGAGIPAGRPIGEETSILDVAPTILSLLKLDVPGEWTGKPIRLDESLSGSEPSA